MTDAEAQLHAVVDAWEALPGGRQCDVRDVEAWLARDMAPAINAIRGLLRRPRPDGALPPSPQSNVMAPAHEPVTLTYTNYRGETSERTILPKHIWFGSTEWHPEPQWLLTAFDLGKQDVRDFALKDFAPPPSTELFGLCALPIPMPFAIGDLVEKHTGDYTAKGEVRGIFATTRGAVRYVVEHQADGGGSFCHIYSEKNLRPARRFAVLPTDCPATSPELLELIAKAKATYEAMSPEEKARHDQAQRESFLRSMMPTGDPRLD
ncbi:hypothetical protein [Agrobacterium vitis]|uniref:hypothetical protein n=1 Tax=Agrobacterium vitis TaxID=373 RepID=UPI0018D1FED9|nr:hypothetical protein [Agrobacterium vitis]